MNIYEDRQHTVLDRSENDSTDTTRKMVTLRSDSRVTQEYFVDYKRRAP